MSQPNDPYASPQDSGSVPNYGQQYPQQQPQGYPQQQPGYPAQQGQGYPQQPPYPQQQPYHQQQYPQQGYAPPQRAAWKMPVGIILIVIAGIFALGTLSGLAQGMSDDLNGGAEWFGFFLAFAFLVLLPLTLGILLVRRPRR